MEKVPFYEKKVTVYLVLYGIRTHFSHPNSGALSRYATLGLTSLGLAATSCPYEELAQYHLIAVRLSCQVFCCGGGIRTHDLWVMSPTSYQLLHPAMFILQQRYETFSYIKTLQDKKK